MQLLVHEYLTGGGLWSESVTTPWRHPLLAEGRCMVQAIGDDLTRVAGVELVQFRDARLSDDIAMAGQVVTIRSARDELDQLAHWSVQADGTLLIAPEHDGRLLKRCEIVQRNGGRLISPDGAFVQLTTDKHATAQHLAAAGVPTPNAMLLHSPSHPLTPSLPGAFTYPAVIKPTDGVGSLDTYLLEGPNQWLALAKKLNNRHPRRWRLEQYHGGTPVSVAALCGPRGIVLLPPCHQRISDDGRFTYLGGRYPLAPTLVRRACQLARKTLAALPPTHGYVGIDMILSDDLASETDVVLEVNPRLTTSYVGLRHAASSNLAEAMLAIGQGLSQPLFFRAGRVEFDCQGRIYRRRTDQNQPRMDSVSATWRLE